MTRRTDQLNRIEQAVARLETALAGHAAHLRSQGTAIRTEVRDARSSAEATHAGIQALAGMLASGQAITQAPQPPSAVPPAAGGGTEATTAAAARRAPKTLRRDQGTQA